MSPCHSLSSNRHFADDDDVRFPRPGPSILFNSPWWACQWVKDLKGLLVVYNLGYAERESCHWKKGLYSFVQFWSRKGNKTNPLVNQGSKSIQIFITPRKPYLIGLYLKLYLQAY